MNDLRGASVAREKAANTKTRILDTAERLFANRGFDATSIRDIANMAKVNLGAVNYHFKTKQELIVAVFLRRVEPMNRHRLALLDDIEHNVQGKPAPVEALIEAMIRPTVESGFGKEGETFLRLTSRYYGELNPEIDRMIRAKSEQMISRFTSAFLRALPKLSPEELFWRLKFSFAALNHLLVATGRKDPSQTQFGKNLDRERLVRSLVTFVAAGFKAPGSK
jgi:AcrR family transcriptional regulator